MRPTSILAILIGCLLGSPGNATEPVIGGPCEGCEHVFVGLPELLESRARIADAEEPGEPLVIEGTVRSADGAAAKDIVIYAYHTDAGGVYPPGTTAHGRLRGWVRTDASGHYRFDTIRPGAYPGRTVAQHVHMHVIEPGRATYYISSIVFDDDPLLTAERRQQSRLDRGGAGLGYPEKDAEGVWHVRRDITLGEAIPGYDPD